VPMFPMHAVAGDICLPEHNAGVILSMPHSSGHICQTRGAQHCKWTLSTTHALHMLIEWV